MLVCQKSLALRCKKAQEPILLLPNILQQRLLQKKAAERSDIMQRLVLPINNFKPIAGYKSEKYRRSGFGLLPASHRQAGITMQAYFTLRRDTKRKAGCVDVAAF